MTKNGQIEEMAKDVCVNCMSEVCASGQCAFQYECPLSIETIKKLYAKGYRKVERGEWKAKPQEGYIGDTEWMCSKCKEEFCPIELTSEEFLQMMKYCPNCGADMRGEKDG